MKAGCLFTQTASFIIFKELIYLTETTAEKRVSAGAAVTPRGNTTGEPVTLLKRIGSTTFVVNVHFSSVSAETLEDKLLRLIERESDKIA
jgi:hypothetical protein